MSKYIKQYPQVVTMNSGDGILLQRGSIYEWIDYDDLASEIVASSGNTLAVVLANGQTTNQLDILSNNSKARLRILDTYSQLDFNDGVGANGQVYIDGTVISLTHTDKVTLNAPIIEVANGSVFKSADANVTMDFDSGSSWYLQTLAGEVYCDVNESSLYIGNRSVGISAGAMGVLPTGFYQINNATDGIQIYSPVIEIGKGSDTSAKLKLYNSTNTNALTIRTGVTANAIEYVLPITDPTVGQVLTASAPSAGVVTLSWGAGGGGGSISGLTTNELVYGNSATTIASLPVATYPSLTELSYVKGVTSAVQTQINAKADITDLPYDISGYRKTGTTTFERWYNQSIVCTALTTVALSKDILRYIPLVIPRDCTMEKLGMEITGAGTAGSVVKIELFNSSNGLPNTVVNTGGTILGDSATSQMLTISQALTAGLYFVATNHNSTANITFRAVPIASLANIHGLPNTAGANIATYFYKSQVYTSPFASPATVPDTVATAVSPACNFYLSA